MSTLYGAGAEMVLRYIGLHYEDAQKWTALNVDSVAGLIERYLADSGYEPSYVDADLWAHDLYVPRLAAGEAMPGWALGIVSVNGELRAVGFASDMPDEDVY